MSNFLGESSVISAAGNSTPREIIRHRGPAKPHILTVRNDGSESLLVTFQRNRNGSTVEAIPDQQVKVSNEATGYTGTGSQKVFTGQSLNAGATTTGAIVPGSVQVDTTTDSPAMQDVNSDGVLWQQAGARAQGSSGTFAAMASESFVVKIDGGAEQTITLGTEATIAAAAAAIDGQLVGADALEQGAQNVDITSQSTGQGSSVQIVSADAGIVTKLGIQVGTSTNLGGSIDYFNGALELSYQGYDPTNLASITADYSSTLEIPGGSDGVMRLSTVADDDEIIVSARGNNGTPKLTADLRPANRNTK